LTNSACWRKSLKTTPPVSAMSATAVISLSLTCRCFTSVGDRFLEILFMGDSGGGHWLVRMEWLPARWSVCLPLLIFPCTIKSRSSLLAPAHPCIINENHRSRNLTHKICFCRSLEECPPYGGAGPTQGIAYSSCK